MIVAGIGFRASASADSLRAAFERAAQGRIPDLIAAPADKAAAPCLTAFAARLGLPVRAIPADRLATTATPTQSARVRALRGTGSVAEAAALAAAGPGARLLTPRQISEDRQATCAVAISGESK